MGQGACFSSRCAGRRRIRRLRGHRRHHGRRVRLCDRSQPPCTVVVSRTPCRVQFCRGPQPPCTFFAREVPAVYDSARIPNRRVRFLSAGGPAVYENGRLSYTARRLWDKKSTRRLWSAAKSCAEGRPGGGRGRSHRTLLSERAVRTSATRCIVGRAVRVSSSLSCRHQASTFAYTSSDCTHFWTVKAHLGPLCVHLCVHPERLYATMDS